MRVRLWIAQTWMSVNDRPYFYAEPAKGPDVAAWKQALLADQAHSSQMSYVCTLLDLVKAFDSVPFDRLAKQAIQYDYNLWLLRLSLAAYRLGRVLCIDGSCSAIVWATRGLTAGSVLATIELRVLLIQWADEAVALSLHARLTVYVDDVTIETVGTVKVVRGQHAKVTNTFISSLIDTRLQFADTKNVTCASTSSLGAEVCGLLEGIAVKAVSRCVSLGTGLGAGNRRNAQQVRKRLRSFRKRIPRFKALRRARVRTDRLLRTGGLVALTFGQRAMGTSNSMLVAQRRAATAASCDRSCGADLDLTLLVADDESPGAADPAFEAHVGVVYMWSLAVWERWAPIGMLHRLITAAINRLSAARQIWSVVYGPTAALIATARRLQWEVHSATQLTADDGTSIDLVVDS